MTDWKNTFDAVFFVSIATLICGVIGLIIKICLKMKCETVSLCCGLITVQRRVDLEVEEEITALELQGGATHEHDQESPPDLNQSTPTKGQLPKIASSPKKEALRLLNPSPPPKRRASVRTGRRNLAELEERKGYHPAEGESLDRPASLPAHSE